MVTEVVIIIVEVSLPVIDHVVAVKYPYASVTALVAGSGIGKADGSFPAPQVENSPGSIGSVGRRGRIADTAGIEYPAWGSSAGGSGGQIGSSRSFHGRL